LKKQFSEKKIVKFKKTFKNLNFGIFQILSFKKPQNLKYKITVLLPAWKYNREFV